MTLAPEKLEENPLLEGLGIARTPESCALVIFGASGDLTHKKLFPALYSLAFRQLLPRNFAVLGVARTEGTDDEFREDMKSAVQEHGRDPFREDIWETLAEAMRYLDMDFGDDASWTKVTRTLADMDKNLGTGGNRVYYFAVPPPVIGTLVEEIGKRRAKNGWNRLVIEKPFGHDLESAQELNAPARQGVRRAAGLPHRPLPRQGDRAEHPGAAVRERHLRAGLEPPATSTTSRSPSPSRSAIEDRGGVLRAGRASSATCSRTTCCSCSR